MTVETLREGAVCADCAIWIANGDLSGMDDEAAARVVEADGENWVLSCAEDCESEFSWSACDRCGTTLGGDRHPAVVLGESDLDEEFEAECDRLFSMTEAEIEADLDDFTTYGPGEEP